MSAVLTSMLRPVAVYVDEDFFDELPEMDEEEEDMLDLAWGAPAPYTHTHTAVRGSASNPYTRTALVAGHVAACPLRPARPLLPAAVPFCLAACLRLLAASARGPLFAHSRSPLRR